MWEFDHFLEFGWLPNSSSPASRDAANTLRRSFEDIARRLDSQIPCLNHRDYHSWNLMIHDEAIAVIDFQDALLAPMQYDLASLLNDRITDGVIRSRLEAALIDHYLGRREELGEGRTDRDGFFEIYLLSAIQRDFKVIGRFIYLDIVKGKSGYRQFIPPTARRLRRNLERLPGLGKIVSILAERFEEMR
jgi:aminoglycoside/choline kinase family phosphotransferase